MECTTRLVNIALDTASELRDCESELTVFESLQIAALIQKNRLFEMANLIGYSNRPVTLEKIGMELEGIAHAIAEKNNQ